MIKYVFPQDTPNKAHLNYIVKSTKVISEYCLFKIVKIHQILHLDRNLDANGWKISEKAFKTHAQKILFNQERTNNSNISNLKEFNLGGTNLSRIYGPNSKEFSDLSKIYNYTSLDLKSIFAFKNDSQIKDIQNLIKKKILFPLLKLKNLNLDEEKIYLILLNIKKALINKIKLIFNYFPAGVCYEITGEYYIYGLEGINEKNFDGLFIKLYLPSTEINSFQKVFDLIFDFLDVKKRLILTDLVDGSQFIESLFGDLKFMESHNPLNSLTWNSVDDRWMNIKLYGEGFIKKYPI